jgi:hypothetical protein
MPVGSLGARRPFWYGTGLCPAQVARHLPGQVLAHELARAFHQHCGPDRLQSANTDVITAYAGNTDHSINEACQY